MQRNEPDSGRQPEREVLPPEAYAAALASVPGIGPRGLRTLLAAGTPPSAWDELVGGRCSPGVARWRAASRAARQVDVAAVWAAHIQAGISVTVLGHAAYPAALAEDPEAPSVLFSLGNLGVVDGRARVAVVGTRSATRYGLGVAAQLGADLAAVGVVVVSGLALGIDGAAHEGALAAWRAAGSDGVEAAAPVAVVAGSLDVPYPRQHAGLWRRVAEAGAVVSEAPLGSTDLGWRFPQRNRIMAAMADVVVVVECHPSGGSMHTVQAAARRGVPVGAVPGSIRSPASAGTNALLSDGCFVVRDVSDVLVAVGLATASAPPRRAVASRSGSGVVPARSASGTPAAGRGGEAGHDGDPQGAAVLDAMGWERCSVDLLLRRTGLELAALCTTLERLRAEGRVGGAGGAWERTERDPL